MSARHGPADGPEGGGATREQGVSLSDTIQGDIEAAIRSGEWAPGDRIPSETEFVARYRYEILLRRVEALPRARASSLRLEPGQPVLRVLCLHVLDDRPHAYEDRVISLAEVPAARDETFESSPPGTWLLGHVPWTEARHTIRAVNADATLAGILGIGERDACLVLNRRTWNQSGFVTDVDITYPGEGHELTGQFSSTMGQIGSLDLPRR